MAHKHDVYDSDAHFTIDPITREAVTESKKVTLIQYDHNSERFTFDIPRYVEGHDMLQCNRVEVHYINVDKKTKESSSDIYTVEDFQESSDSEETAVLSWLISGNATKHVGSLNFVIRFSCVAEDGTVEYAWHTAIYKSITVSSGILNTDAVAEEYSDVLAAWEARITALEQGGGFEETDPTVPAWAKQPEKPSYTAAEVGALPADTVIPTVPENVSAFKNDAGYLTEHQSLADYVKSSELAAVAKSGSYGDLTGKPTIPTVPTAVSAFTNDTGYQTEAQVNVLIDTALGVIENGSY